MADATAAHVLARRRLGKFGSCLLVRGAPYVSSTIFSETRQCVEWRSTALPLVLPTPGSPVDTEICVALVKRQLSKRNAQLWRW